MIDLKKRSDYFKNILTLFTGIVIAQGIQVVLFLILPRLYIPENFGRLTLLLSAVSFLSVVSTGRYELAILLPKRQNTAFNILKLVLVLSFTFNSILFIVLILFRNIIVEKFKLDVLGGWYYLLPLIVFFNTFSIALSYWFNRNREYKIISTNKVAENSIFGGLAIFLGVLKWPFGLVFGRVIGQFSGVLLYLTKLKRSGSSHFFFKENNPRIFKATAKRYKNFPQFSLPAGLFNTGAAESPSFLINSFFNHTVLGYLGFANQISTAPIGIISKSIGSVFAEQAAKNYQSEGRCDIIFNKTFRVLLALSIVPFVLFYFFAPDLFAFVFGEHWRQSGEYARILTPMYFCQFISNPMQSVVVIAEKQNVDLVLEILLFVGVVSGIVIGALYFDITTALRLYSGAYCAYYLIILAFCYKFSKGEKKGIAME